jgi:signal transduction histidine kinase
VDSCGGSIHVTSQLGQGTCVTVRLPLAGFEDGQQKPLQLNEPAIR